MTPAVLSELERRYRVPGWRTICWLIIVVIAAFIGWVAVAQVDEVAVATGEVVPRGQVKLIQHLEGGIVREIMVADGDQVKAGDPLVRLELARADSNAEELRIRIEGLQLVRTRLQAEAEGRNAVDFDPELARRHPAIVATEHDTFTAHLARQGARMAALESELRQRELDLSELQARQRALSNDLALAREKLAISTLLIEKSLTPKLEHIQLQRDVQELQGQLATIQPALPRAEAAIAAARDRLREEELNARSAALVDLSNVEREVSRLTELRSQADEQVGRTTIRAPIDGVVKNLSTNTIGGVVGAGDAIMEIVPTDEALVIQAQLKPSDRGYVREGQPALVKITAYDFIQYGGLPGKVLQIAADSNRDADGNAYFKLLVETDRGYLEAGTEKLVITPGMEATVDIQTGTRSVLAFLLKPFLRLRLEAFRER
jgi:adhesin transport system membrane fusion protein